MNKLSKGLLTIHLAVLLFGTAGLFGKLLDLSPAMIVFGRVAFAALFLGIYQLIFRLKYISNLRYIDNRDSNTGQANGDSSTRYIVLILLLGLILTVHWVTFFHSIQLSTVAIGLLSFSTFPIFVVFMEPLFLRSDFRVKYLLFAMITLAGIWLLVPEFRWVNRYFQGVVWGCISGFLFAVLTVINKYLAKSFKAVSLAFFQNGIAFIILLPFVIRSLIGNVTLNEWLVLLLLGVVFTAVSHTMFIYGLRTVKARVAGIIACMEPVYGIIFAFFLLAEIPQARTLIGGIIIIGTTIYLTLDRN